MRRTAQERVDRAVAEFLTRFGSSPTACGVAPGRVEVLGNHTDYNGGCVLTAAIDRRVVAVGRPVRMPTVRVRSLDLDAEAEFSLDSLVPEAGTAWASYVTSAFAMLQRAGVDVGGMDITVASDVPIGAGLSSSAALEAAVAMLILQVYPHPIDRLELARLLQRGEHEFAGVRCGLLDQFSTLFGQQDRLLFLDCASCEHEAVSLGGDPPAIVVCDSRVLRQLGRDAPYNIRRQECESARDWLQQRLGRPLSALCQVSMRELNGVAGEMPEPLLSRAWHVLGEQDRVLAARACLRVGDVQRLGVLMDESHASSRTRFENSCPALDRVCETAARQPGCLGSRLCGAGWGGCTIHLVRAEALGAFVGGMRRNLVPTPGSPPVEIHVCSASDGAVGHDLPG